MEILILRKWPRATYTIGQMFVNGEFFCNTLEDTDRGLSQELTEEENRARKVYGETAIPRGRYKVTLSLSPKFKRILPAINGVKGFSGIRIHSGNTAKDSLGCILVGKNTAVGKVTESRKTEAALVKKMIDCGEDIYITIR